jgi:hypothetical protein
MMIDNRKRKRVKRCSGANLILAMKMNETTYTCARLLSHLILRSITVEGKWNHACMRKEMMRWCVCEKDEMLTGLSSLFNYFSFSFIVVYWVHIHLYIYIYWQCKQLSSFIDVQIYSFSLTLLYCLSVIYIWVCVYVRYSILI